MYLPALCSSRSLPAQHSHRTWFCRFISFGYQLLLANPLLRVPTPPSNSLVHAVRFQRHRVPPLFAVAGAGIGGLYILLDAASDLHWRFGRAGVRCMSTSIRPSPSLSSFIHMLFGPHKIALLPDATCYITASRTRTPLIETAIPRI